METITGFPKTFSLDGVKFEINDGQVIWINPEGIESRVVLEGKIKGLAIFEDKKEYVMTIRYPDGMYCISHQNGMFGPFKEIKDVYYDDDNQVPVVSGTRDDRQGKFSLDRNSW